MYFNYMNTRVIWDIYHSDEYKRYEHIVEWLRNKELKEARKDNSTHQGYTRGCCGAAASRTILSIYRNNFNFEYRSW